MYKVHLKLNITIQHMLMLNQQPNIMNIHNLQQHTFNQLLKQYKLIQMLKMILMILIYLILFIMKQTHKEDKLR